MWIAQEVRNPQELAMLIAAPLAILGIILIKSLALVASHA